MRPCDNVIVTLLVRDQVFDVELPAFLPVEELVNKIEELFEVMKPQWRVHGLRLYFAGKELQMQQTLATCGIWDGAQIQCQF